MRRSRLYNQKLEFIGKIAKIFYGKDIISGEIINETKNTIWIKKEDKIKKYIKNQIIIKIDNQKIIGSDISKRPEERIKAC